MTMHDHKMKHKALQVLRCVVLVTTTTSHTMHTAQSAGGGDAAAVQLRSHLSVCSCAGIIELATTPDTQLQLLFN